MVDVANSLEENIKPVVSFHLPKHLPMFEPGMRKDPIQPTEDINQMSHARLRTTARLRAQRQPTGEVLGGRQDVGRPVERVAAVIDGAAGFTLSYLAEWMERSLRLFGWFGAILGFIGWF